MNVTSNPLITLPTKEFLFVLSIASLNLMAVSAPAIAQILEASSENRLLGDLKLEIISEGIIRFQIDNAGSANRHGLPITG